MYYRSQYINKNITINALVKILKPFGLGFRDAEKLISKWEDAGLLARNEDGYYSHVPLDDLLKNEAEKVSPSLKKPSPPNYPLRVPLRSPQDFKDSLDSQYSQETQETLDSIELLKELPVFVPGKAALFRSSPMIP